VTAVKVWGPRSGRTGPVHLAQPEPHDQLSWCGARAQFRHQRHSAPLEDVTCPRCLRQYRLGRVLAYRAGR
jgi:hypothetical protein